MSWLPAQEAGESTNDEAVESAPSLTPDERRARWEEMRGASDEERRQRMEQWREAREGRAEETPEGAAPERYIDQLEFRSILSLGGVTQFSLRNPYENRTLTLSTEEGRNGVEVVEFDAESNALTISHEEETRTLYLRTSRVAEMAVATNEDEERGSRREQWEARRQRFEEFRAAWDKAAEDSPELREIQTQFRELGGAFRQNREALRAAEEGTPEHQRLQEQEREMREEFRLLGEYSMLEVQRNPAFAEQDVDSLRGMMRGMAWRSGDDDRRGGERGR